MSEKQLFPILETLLRLHPLFHCAVEGEHTHSASYNSQTINIRTIFFLQNFRHYININMKILRPFQHHLQHHTDKQTKNWFSRIKWQNFAVLLRLKLVDCIPIFLNWVFCLWPTEARQRLVTFDQTDVT